MGCSTSTSACTSASTSLQQQRKIALFYALEEMGNQELAFAAMQQTAGVMEGRSEMETLTLVVTKEQEVPFGAALDKDKSEEVAVITRIDDDGYLKKWNTLHPSEQLCLGDRIVGVNDCSKDYWEMVAQLWYSRECRLTVERNPRMAQNYHRCGSRLYLAEACSKLAYSHPVEQLKVTRAGDQSGSECAVCLENYEDPNVKVVVLPCNHVFHSACVSRWLCKGGKYCPVCKAAVSDCAIKQEKHNEASMDGEAIIDDVHVV